MTTNAADSGVWTLLSGDELRKDFRKRMPRSLVKLVSSRPREEAKAKRAKWEADGWVFEKRNKKTFRMTKPKPVGQALEDYVWSLLAAMGFEEMSSGRNFQIPVGTAKPKQVDVFAKDDLSALVVSCKESAVSGPRSLQGELESLNGLSPHFPDQPRGCVVIR